MLWGGEAVLRDGKPVGFMSSAAFWRALGCAVAKGYALGTVQMKSIANELLKDASLSCSFACSAAETVPPLPGSNCSIVKEATPPLIENDRRYLVPVNINGHDSKDANVPRSVC